MPSAEPGPFWKIKGRTPVNVKSHLLSSAHSFLYGDAFRNIPLLFFRSIRQPQPLRSLITIQLGKDVTKILTAGEGNPGNVTLSKYCGHREETEHNFTLL